MKEIDKLNYRPFTRFCMSIGAVPSSYLAGLTIEEQLLWFCSYLEKEVIPTVNNNGEAVTELQNLFTELHDYVEHYFDNLDVQEEINNKLDVMATDGTLETIINQEIFGEINETLASHTEDIRSINNDIEGIEGDISDLESELQTDITSINLHTKQDLGQMPTLFIGDSYTNQNPSYADIYKTKTGLSTANFFKYASGGAGFYSTGSGGNTFIDLINTAKNNMTTEQKNSIKLIIVGSCLNDASYNSTANQIKQGLSDFMEVASSDYPNATVYIIPCGNRIGTDATSNTARNNMATIVIPTLKDRTLSYNNQPIVIDNANNWLLNSDWFEDGMHPNSTGKNIIANSLIKALEGETDIQYDNTTILTFTKSGASNETLSLPTEIKDNMIIFKLASTSRLYNVESITGMGMLSVGTWTNALLHPTANSSLDIPIYCKVRVDNSNDQVCSGFLRLAPDGTLYLYTNSLANVTGITNFSIIQFKNTQYKYLF